MKPLVYIIILNWNGRDLILDCLDSVLKVKYDNLKVLVVDNHSEDDSVKSIRKYYPDVEIMELDKNYGYAEGNNKGFESINNQNVDYVVFLNNDTLVDTNFVEPLISELEENQSIGQTVPKIFYSDSNKVWYAGGLVNPWIGSIKHIGIRQADSQKFNEKDITDYATGCCFAMRYKDFKMIGGFDTDYPMYCEDVDLSLRIQKFGQDIMYVPESKIYHKVSSSVGGELSLKKIKRKLHGYIKLFLNHSNILQKISIPLFWILSVPFILLKYIYLLMTKK